MPRHLAHVIGARPDFIKAAPVIRALRERDVPQRIAHTGQHYDEVLSDVFFRDLEIQEETTMLDVPCLTMRPNTERPITVSHGTNRLVSPDAVVTAAREIIAGPVRPRGPRPPLWDGHAGDRIANEIVDWLALRAAGSVA